MREEDLFKLLYELKNSNSFHTTDYKNYDISSIELPSPIQSKKYDIQDKILREVKQQYDFISLNKTTYAKDFLANNQQKVNLYALQDDYKESLKTSINNISLNFNLWNKTQEDLLIAKDESSLEEAPLLYALESVWENDIKKLSIKEMMAKWEIPIPNLIQLENNEVATFIGFGETNNMYYKTNSGDSIEIFV